MTAFLWNWSNVNRLYNWHPVEKSRKKRAAHIWKQKKQNTFLTWTNVFTADEKLLLIGKWYAWVSFTLNLMTRFLFVTLKLSTLICTRHEKKDSNNSNNNKNHSNHAFVYTSHIWHKTIFFPPRTQTWAIHSLWPLSRAKMLNIQHTYTPFTMCVQNAHTDEHPAHTSDIRFDLILNAYFIRTHGFHSTRNENKKKNTTNTNKKKLEQEEEYKCIWGPGCAYLDLLGCFTQPTVWICILLLSSREH